jgi:hypothetical protein
MVYVYARHEVESYERWERHHEANAVTRAEHGSFGSVAYRQRGGADGSETVLVLLEIADDRLDEALSYFRSAAFEATMAEAGATLLDAGVVEKTHEMDA